MLLGRKEEQKTLKHHYQSKESRLIAVYGRRRVGKTFLVREYFGDKIMFEVAGLHGGNMQDQLMHFASALVKHGYQDAMHSTPKSWMAAFDLLGFFIDQLKGKGKKVIFIDELPWFDTARSKFLMAFENFWNSYCSRRKDILMIICGSAASWMIKKILSNKGGLHNRISERINLQPFNLATTKLFLKHKGIVWSKYDIAQLYMILGGVPYYIESVRKGESLMQFINRVCFDRAGLLFLEYENLYASLFSKSEDHEIIVATLAKKKKGMGRNDLIKATGLSSGGMLTSTLDELEKSGFIQKVIPYGANKNNSLYQLIDPFTFFYFKFMSVKGRRNTDDWNKKINSPSWKSWSGFAFERLCFSHANQILETLGLRTIETEVTTFQSKGRDETDGAQIDLLIDRVDRIINVCEIKFSGTEFTITRPYARNLRNKLAVFGSLKNNKRKTLFLTMITTFGARDNEYFKELVQNEIVLDDLFKT